MLAKAAQYINLIFFIKDGIYRSLALRLLKIQMKFIDSNKSRLLDFTLMNRQLLWNIYEEFLSTILPFLSKTLGGSLKKIFYLYAYMDAND